MVSSWIQKLVGKEGEIGKIYPYTKIIGSGFSRNSKDFCYIIIYIYIHAADEFY